MHGHGSSIKSNCCTKPPLMVGFTAGTEIYSSLLMVLIAKFSNPAETCFPLLLCMKPVGCFPALAGSRRRAYHAPSWNYGTHV